jgi:putative peptide maturation dehydrogenase
MPTVLPRRLRRCRHLMVELDDTPRVALSDILAGGSGRISTPRWLARAAHLDAPVPVDLAQLQLLQALPREAAAAVPIPAAAEAALGHLLEHALAFDLDAAATPAQQRDDALAALPWWTPAAVAQAQGRWHDNDIAALWARLGKTSSAELVQRYGPAPVPDGGLAEAASGSLLPMFTASAFDPLLEARRTCRQFDPQAALDAESLSSVLYRSAAAQGIQTLAEGAWAVKKYAPAGGGLHATDLRLLLRRVEGFSPGLYRYDPFRHALLPQQALDGEAGDQLAYRMLGGQDWFLAAPVLIVLVSRYDRLFWKYRGHSKAWKVAQLDAGHLSQLLYLAAAERGLGAFVSAAVNDAVVEQAFGLDPAREGVAALLGVGRRGGEPVARELDDWQPTPARQRWLQRNPACASTSPAADR